MERTIRDLMTQEDGILSRVATQLVDATVGELNAIRTALKGLLSVAQATATRRAGSDRRSD